MRLLDDGKSIKEIRTYIDSTYSQYGPSTNTQQLMSPRTRDWDNDGIPNYLDRDDDQDGLFDDQDSNPYSN